MRFLPWTAPAVVLLATAAALPAQSPPQLVGLTRNAPALRGLVLDGTCQTVTRCAVPMTPTPTFVAPWAGGTGYDARHDGVWISDGQQLSRVSVGSCNVQCAPFPAPLSSPTAVVTGLAVNLSEGELVQIDSAGFISRIDLDSCGVAQVVSTCQTGDPSSVAASTTGLAVDEANGLLFYSYSNFSTGQSRIAVASYANPCTILDTLPVPQACPTTTGSPAFGPVRGLAAEWCRQVLHITDGHRAIGVAYQWNPLTGITWGAMNCCNPPAVTSDPLTGLAVVPGEPTSLGTSCANGVCAPCPMRHQILGGTSVGNTDLVFALDRAQLNSWAYLAIGFGSCTPNGVSVFPLCGPILVNQQSGPATVYGPYLTSGSGQPCSGQVQVQIGIPLDPSFCGSRWSSQFITLCFGGGGAFGTGMSNCQSFGLGGY